MPSGYDIFSTLNPGQQGIFDRQSQGYQQGPQSLYQDPLYQGGASWLQQLLSNDPAMMQQFQAPYLRQFNEQTVPGLAERFSGLGSGAQGSSAFKQALGSAGAGLSENLASLRGGMQLQGLGQALQYAQQPFSNQQGLLGLNTQSIQQQQPGFIQQLMLALAGGAGSAATKAATAGIF